ncbi:MAG TPA: HAMP domain-containing sensor histidine kinase [Trebonia sp.]
MNARSLRRLWPQKVRTRLTLIYAAPFLVAGLAVFGLALFVLQRVILPTSPTANLIASGKMSGSVAQLCQAYTTTSTSLCERAYAAYYAGTVAGMQAQQNTLAKLLAFWAVGLGIMTVASGGLGWYISGRLLRPVREITETARRASEQHLGERLALTGPRDELRELGDTFDGMLERLDGAFAAQGRFVANASHELRTPLTVMRTAIDVTLAKPAPSARQLTDMAVRVRRSIDKAETMIEALLTLAVSDRGKLSTEQADLATWAEDAIDAAAPEIARLNLTVEAKLDPAETAGDPQLLERMITNLVGNAVRHNESGGWIRLRTGSSPGAAYVEIANGGPVIPDDKVAGLFEPFRRMESRTGSSDGVGLGLSIVRSVATAHHATVTARSQPGGGLAISVVIPREYVDLNRLDFAQS